MQYFKAHKDNALRDSVLSRSSPSIDMVNLVPPEVATADRLVNNCIYSSSSHHSGEGGGDHSPFLSFVAFSSCYLFLLHTPCTVSETAFVTAWRGNRNATIT